MILVILAVVILLVILGIIIDNFTDCGATSLFCVVVGGFGTIITLCIAIFLIAMTSGSIVIDDKIAMYEKENKSIETSVSIIVENYQGYEKEIFDNAKPKDFIAIATQVYPELKSNDLVKKQIDVYVSNNEKIKSLKEEKIDYKIYKWWLYFGG